MRRSVLSMAGRTAAWTRSWLAALLLTASPQVAHAQSVDVTGAVDGGTVAPGDDINMDGGTLFFNAGALMDNNVYFVNGAASTITAAAGTTVVFGGFFNDFLLDAGTTAVFGAPGQTGTIHIDGPSTFGDPTAKIVVAGGTFKGDFFALGGLLGFAESTTVNAGATLDLDDDSGMIRNLKGAGHVATGSGGGGGFHMLTLFVDDGATSEFSGVISGSGHVLIENFMGGLSEATMILSGDNTYTGGTSICFCSVLQLGNGGTTGSIQGDIENGGTLAFNRSDIYVFSGTIADFGFDQGKVVQAGTGTTVLAGTNTYTGTTTVAAGKLVVNGSIADSETTVLTGATLGGTGILGRTTIASGGVHAPGNSIGTQTVAGNYALASGAVLEIEADASGAADKVVVTGSVSLTGAVLRVLAGSGNYTTAGTAYVIIENDGADAVTGAFGSVTSNLAFLTPSLVYDGGTGNDVVLTLARNATYFRSVATTPNETGVANALDSLPLTDPVVEAVLGQDEDGARAAFEALSGEVHATLGGLMIEDSRFLREAVLARLAQAFYTGNAAGAAIASGGPVTVAALDQGRMALGMGASTGEAPRTSKLAFWTDGYGSWADADSSGTAAAADRTLGGFVSGMDAAIGGSWRVGLATGYEQANMSVGALGSEADAERYHLAAYAGGGLGPLALRGGASWTWHDIDTDRVIAFPGFVEHAEASYDGDTGQIFGEAALPFVSGRSALEPFAGLAYVHVETDAFTETGSSGALQSSGLEEEVTFSTLGIRAATTLELSALTVMPRVSAAWRHAFDETVPGLALAFASGPSFGIEGLPIAEDSALIEAGLDVLLSPNARLGVAYSGQFAADIEDHGVKGTLLWQF